MVTITNSFSKYQQATYKGYEIDKIGTTNLTITKIRQVKEIKGAKTPTRLETILNYKTVLVSLILVMDEAFKH